MVKARPLAAAFWLLSMIDLLMTKVAVAKFGAVEANPVMSLFLKQGFLWAFLFKGAAAALLTLIAAAFWFSPAIRRVVGLGILLLVAVIGYQIGAMVLIYVT